MKKLKKFYFPLANYFLLLYNTEVRTNENKQARLAQLVEHLTLNQGVQGSRP